MIVNKCKKTRGGGTLSTPDEVFRGLSKSRFKHFAFTLAEMMVVMLILSIVMAAMAPVMTTRNKLDQSSPWVWAENGSDAYYGLGDAQVAMIGQQKAEDTDTNSRLVINTGDGKDHILFKQGNSVLGSLRFDNNGLLLGSLSSGNLVENSVAIGRNTQVAQDNSTAVGVNASATNSNATAIGHSASASGTYAIAIGGEAPPAHAAQSNGDGSIAIGAATVASQAGSIAMGPITESTGLHSIAIGTNNKVSGPDSVVIGSNITANDAASNSIVVGSSSTVNSPNSVTIGISGTAAGNSGVAIGYDRVISGSRGIAIGTLVEVEDNGIGIGDHITSGQSALSMGYRAIGTGTNSIAIGNNSSAEPIGSIAIGNNAQASIGYPSNSYAAIAIGLSSVASGAHSIAIGGSDSSTNTVNSPEATGTHSIAIGYGAKAPGTYGIAIGDGAKASGLDNIAIGMDACRGVTGTHVTCLGANSGPVPKYSHLSGDSNMVYIGDSNSTVFIPGNLAVRGTVLLNGERGRVVLRPGNAQGDWAVIRRGDYDGGDDNLRGYPTDVGEDKAWYDRYSDRRLKYVGKESTSGLEKIKQLKVFNYTFKKDEKKTPHVGVIAQDLQKVFPDAVTKAKDGFLRIRFEDMFYAMINAIKELDSRITALEKENQQMSEILKQVQNDNRKLNAILNRVQDDNRKLQDDNKEFETRLKILEAKIK